MSELSSKLKREAQTKGTKAIATRAQLNNRWCRMLDDQGELIRISTMGGVELWRLIDGSGREARFEKQN